MIHREDVGMDEMVFNAGNVSLGFFEHFCDVLLEHYAFKKEKFDVFYFLCREVGSAFLRVSLPHFGNSLYVYFRLFYYKAMV